MIKTGIAYLLDEDILLKGTVEEKDAQKVFVPDYGIECGFSYQVLNDEDAGTILFYNLEEAKAAGLGDLEVAYKDGENIMIDNMSWFFEISEKAGMANDEDGNPAPCYCSFKVGFKKPINEEEVEVAYNEQLDVVKEQLSKALKIPVEYLRVITEKEYLENTEEDASEDEDF